MLQELMGVGALLPLPMLLVVLGILAVLVMVMCAVPTTTSALRGVRPDLMGAVLDIPATDPNYMRRIGHRICPVVPRQERSGDYGRVKREALLRVAQTLRAPGARVNRSHMELDSLFWKTEEHSHAMGLDDAFVATYESMFDLEASRAVVISGIIFRAEEQRIADLTINDATTFPASGTTGLAVTVQWDTPTADIIGDVRTGINAIHGKTGIRPNRLAVNWKTLLAMANNDDLVERFKHTMPMASEITKIGSAAEVANLDRLAAALAPALGLQAIEWAMVPYNAADEGLDYSGADIWNNDLGFLYFSSENPSPEFPSCGKTFAFTKNGGEFAVVDWREDDPPQTVHKAMQDVQNQVPYPELGFRYTGLAS